MSDDITVYEPKEVVETGKVYVQPSAFEMMISLSEKGIGPEEIEKMMAIIERQDARQAEKAFVAALADFKANPPVITKDKDNKQYKSKYCSLENLLFCTSERMGQCGLSHRWEVSQNAQNNNVSVKCVLTHVIGHSESVQMAAPPDKSGSKNPIQEMKSTITYLKSVTLESILGVAATDANLSDDGNGFKQPKMLDGKRLSEIFDLVEVKIINPADYLLYCQNTHGVGASFDIIPEKSYQAIRSELASMPDKQVAE